MRRAEHDQGLGAVQGIFDLGFQITAGCELLTIPEDALEALGNEAMRALAANQLRRHSIRFEAPMKPPSDILVPMAIANERRISTFSVLVLPPVFPRIEHDEETAKRAA